MDINEREARIEEYKKLINQLEEIKQDAKASGNKKISPRVFDSIEEIKKGIDEEMESIRRERSNKPIVNNIPIVESKIVDPDLIAEPKQKKKWFKIFKSDKAKKNKVAIIYLSNDGEIKPIYKEVKDGLFKINGKTYHETDCYHTYGRKRMPAVVIPEWGLIPISRENYAKNFAADAQEAQQLIIKAVENAEIVRLQEQQGKKIDPKLVLGIIAIAIVGIYFYQQYAGKSAQLALPIVRGVIGI